MFAADNSKGFVQYMILKAIWMFNSFGDHNLVSFSAICSINLPVVMKKWIMHCSMQVKSCDLNALSDIDF